MLYKKLILCGLVVLTAITGKAQLYNTLTSEYAHINSAFLDPAYQSFDVNYYYSTENTPAVYIDSVKASFQVHNGNYFGHFGQNTVMQDSLYLISFYDANGTIIVSNPAKQKTAIMQGVNFDSAFLATNVDSAWITDQGSVRSILYRFTSTSSFKNCTVTYNKNNYQLQKIVYSMKQQMLDPGDTVNMPGNPYISILFSGFSQAAFSDSVFDHNRYVAKDSSGQFRGVGVYSSYEVLSTYRDNPDSIASGSSSLHRSPDHLLPFASPVQSLVHTQLSPGFARLQEMRDLWALPADLQRKDKLSLPDKGARGANMRGALLKS